MKMLPEILASWHLSHRLLPAGRAGAGAVFEIDLEVFRGVAAFGPG
jgi:hypothetical protein